jgi:hypothetical protein
MANGFVVVAFGTAARRRDERGSSLRKAFSANHREALSREYSTMLRDTLTITLVTSLPFVLLIAVTTEKGHA